MPSDDMYDIVVQQRKPRSDRRSPRSTVEKYLPPFRQTVCHLYLCNECAPQFVDFLKLYEGGKD